MTVLGQARCSKLIVEQDFAPRSVRTVALVPADDARLASLAAQDGIEVVIDEVAGAVLQLSTRTPSERAKLAKQTATERRRRGEPTNRALRAARRGGSATRQKTLMDFATGGFTVTFTR